MRGPGGFVLRVRDKATVVHPALVALPYEDSIETWVRAHFPHATYTKHRDNEIDSRELGDILRHARGIVAVQGQKSLGKSKAIQAAVHALPAATSVLQVTFRRSLAWSSKKLLGPTAKVYLEVEDAAISVREHPRLTILVNSVCRVRGCYEVVVVDELVSVVDALAGRMFTPSARASAVATFAHVLGNARVVLCADAALDPACLQFLALARRDTERAVAQIEGLRGRGRGPRKRKREDELDDEKDDDADDEAVSSNGSAGCALGGRPLSMQASVVHPAPAPVSAFAMDVAVPIRVLDYVHRMHANYTFVAYAAESEWRRALDACLRSGNNVVVPCMTKAMAERLGALYDTQYSTRVYTAGTDAVELQTAMADINTHWKQCQLLVYSPVITAGCSFEEAHFDVVFFYGMVGLGSVRSALQMLARVRAVSTHTVHVYIARADEPAYYFQPGSQLPVLSTTLALDSTPKHAVDAGPDTTTTPASVAHDGVTASLACSPATLVAMLNHLAAYQRAETDMCTHGFPLQFWTLVVRSGAKIAFPAQRDFRLVPKALLQPSTMPQVVYDAEIDDAANGEGEASWCRGKSGRPHDRAITRFPVCTGGATAEKWIAHNWDAGTGVGEAGIGTCTCASPDPYPLHVPIALHPSATLLQKAGVVHVEHAVARGWISPNVTVAARHIGGIPGGSGVACSDTLPYDLQPQARTWCALVAQKATMARFGRMPASSTCISAPTWEAEPVIANACGLNAGVTQGAPRSLPAAVMFTPPASIVTLGMFTPSSLAAEHASPALSRYLDTRTTWMDTVTDAWVVAAMDTAVRTGTPITDSCILPEFAPLTDISMSRASAVADMALAALLPLRPVFVLHNVPVGLGIAAALAKNHRQGIAAAPRVVRTGGGSLPGGTITQPAVPAVPATLPQSLVSGPSNWAVADTLIKDARGRWHVVLWRCRPCWRPRDTLAAVVDGDIVKAAVLAHAVTDAYPCISRIYSVVLVYVSAGVAVTVEFGDEDAVSATGGGAGGGAACPLSRVLRTGYVPPWRPALALGIWQKRTHTFVVANVPWASVAALLCASAADAYAVSSRVVRESAFMVMDPAAADWTTVHIPMVTWGYAQYLTAQIAKGVHHCRHAATVADLGMAVAFRVSGDPFAAIPLAATRSLGIVDGMDPLWNLGEESNGGDTSSGTEESDSDSVPPLNNQRLLTEKVRPLLHQLLILYLGILRRGMCVVAWEGRVHGVAMRSVPRVEWLLNMHACLSAASLPSIPK